MPLKPVKAVIMDMITQESKEFQFNPTPINEEISVFYSEITSPGLAHPLFQYVRGEADIITFTIQLDDLGMYSGYTEEFLTFMERFKPEQTGRFKPPPPVIIAYGTLYRKGLITSMRLKRDRFDPTSLSTIRATLDVSIKSLPNI